MTIINPALDSTAQKFGLAPWWSQNIDSPTPCTLDSTTLGTPLPRIWTTTPKKERNLRLTYVLTVERDAQSIVQTDDAKLAEGV